MILTKKEESMKKLVRWNKMLLTAMLCVCTMFGTSIVAHAQSTEEMPNDERNIAREILTGSTTQILTYTSGYSVRVTIRYTWRYEASNSSKKYITGILGGTILVASGWTSISSTYVNVNSVSYERNNQTAYVPISYIGSIGSGPQVYVAQTFIFSL